MTWGDLGSTQKEAVTPSEMVQDDVFRTSQDPKLVCGSRVLFEHLANITAVSSCPKVHKTLPGRGTGRNPNEAGVSRLAKVIHPTWRQLGNRARHGRPTEVPRSGHAWT